MLDIKSRCLEERRERLLPPPRIIQERGTGGTESVILSLLF